MSGFWEGLPSPVERGGPLATSSKQMTQVGFRLCVLFGAFRMCTGRGLRGCLLDGVDGFVGVVRVSW